MPSLARSTIALPPNMAKLPAPAAGRPAPPMLGAHGRSPVMLASLPGVGSGPDAVVRQFNTTAAPQSRILVP